MGPYRPPTSDQELEETLRRGESKLARDERPATPGSVAVIIGWAALLVVIAWGLIQLGIIDPDFCRGSANPLSC